MANEKLINGTLEEEFDLAIFPEMFYSGYMVRDNVNLFSLRDDFVRQIQDGIGDRMLIFGTPYRDRFLYNSAVAVTEKSVEVYRKDIFLISAHLKK